MALNIKPRLLLDKPSSTFFRDTVGINPDFSQTKKNNYFAFRALDAISQFHGNIDDPNFPPQIKKIILEEKSFYDAENRPILSSQIKQFLKAWPQIEADTVLCAKIRGVLSNLNDNWSKQNYASAISIYTDRENFPLYFDMVDYLNSLLDSNGNIKPNALTTQSEYRDLTEAWRAEIDEQYKEYAKSKSNGEAE